jgi:hypothetical protein
LSRIVVNLASRQNPSKDFGIPISHFSCGADMARRIAGSNSQRNLVFQRLGLKALMLLLFFYFSYSGATELGYEK